MADGSLFRTKAVEAKSDNRLGEIAISQPIGIWVLAGIAIAILTSAALFLIFGEYTRKTEVTGRLVPTAGLSTLTATGNGNVGRLFVKEGDTVKAGDPLVLIESDRNLADGRDANAALIAGIDQKQRSLAGELRDQDALMATQRRGMKEQLRTTQQELQHLQQELVIRQDQVKLSADTLNRFRSLLDQKYVSQIQVTQQEQALLEQRANVETMQRNIATLQRNLVQIRQTISELPTRNHLLRMQAQRESAILDQERITGTANATTLIKAKADGTVSNKMVELGQAVQAGQPIMTILPKSTELMAMLLVPSSAVGFIRNGDEVLIGYHAFPQQKFGNHTGYVREIGKGALSAAELVLMSGDTSKRESHFLVYVRLMDQRMISHGKAYRLRPGMDIDAEILGESRSLMSWIFNPSNINHQH